MKKACVIGHPIAHSKSPLIHGYWLEKYGIEGRYDRKDIAPEDLREGIEALKSDGYAGFNVTVPHKETIMALCDHVDETAKIIGAVNTVVIDPGGNLNGTNTDWIGFWNALKHTLPDFDAKAGPAMVLGAGGAARAIIYALTQAGVPEIVLCNRTKEKAENLKRDFLHVGSIRVMDWDERSALEGFNLLVNTTTLGMAGQHNLDIMLDRLPQSALVSDIVYTPLMTVLLHDAQSRGNKIVTGIGMLLHQAAPGFEAWFRVKPDVTEDLVKMVLAA